MDRDTAVELGQQAILKNNRRLIDAVLKIRSARGAEADERPPAEKPLIAVTCATGWECYAVAEELVNTGKFRVRALYRTPGTQAAQRLEQLQAETEAEHPGLMSIVPGIDMNSAEQLTHAFQDCDGVVLYVTANTSRAGKITNHGKDPVGGRAAVMRQVLAALQAFRANPSVQQVVTLVFPTDKVSGFTETTHPIPWWIHQRLRISNFLRGQGINVSCIHRPAYYYGMHRVDWRGQAEFRGSSRMSRNMIKAGSIPGITDPDYMVNWVDVRDVGKWVGTCFEYPEVFSNRDFSIASCAHTGNELVALAEQHNRHGTKFAYQQFPRWLMKLLSRVTEEVVYPLRYAEWYNDRGNAYDFASEADLADLDRIHPRWTFEKKLEQWGINELRPGG